MKLNVVIYPDWMAGGFRLVVFDPAKQKENEPVAPEYSVIISKQEAARLAEQLDHIGVESERQKQDREQTPAMRRHLEDMRAITFAKLNIEAPKGTP